MIVNKILICILDNSIPDFSEEFPDTDPSTKIRYFEKLVGIMNHYYIKHNTRLVSMSKVASQQVNYSENIKPNLEENNSAKEISEPKPAKLNSRPTSAATILTVSDSYKDNSLNYYLRFIIPKKLYMQKAPGKLLGSDMIQIQVLCCIFVEIGLHCKQGPLCITLISFLEEEDKKQFECFFKRDKCRSQKTHTLNEPTSSYAIYNDNINNMKNNNEETIQKNELKLRISKLENANELLKYELEESKRETKVAKTKLHYFERIHSDQKELGMQLDELTFEMHEKDYEIQRLKKQCEKLSMKSYEETQLYTAKIEELQSLLDEFRNQQEHINDRKRLQAAPISAKPNNATVADGKNTRNDIRNCDTVKALQWEISLLEECFFENLASQIKQSEELCSFQPPMFTVKKSGREIYNLLAN